MSYILQCLNTVFSSMVLSLLAGDRFDKIPWGSWYGIVQGRKPQADTSLDRSSTEILPRPMLIGVAHLDLWVAVTGQVDGFGSVAGNVTFVDSILQGVVQK